MILREQKNTVFPVARWDYSVRPTVRGKFLYVGDKKFWVKGVTYGTFRPDENGDHFPPRQQVEQDFTAMAENEINCVRTYTPVPYWLLDVAQKHGLRVMVGLAWEQHVTFLDDKTITERIIQNVRKGARDCANHPALLCFSVGNEIPPSIVRWHGRQRIEKFVHTLYREVKAEDPNALVTYVSYPTTEYLQLSFLDFISFNVYLEEPAKLEAYLARLQNIAKEKPLLMAEIGLDSRTNGEDTQATSLNWQIRTSFAAGCAGALVFAWTDEWYRGGDDIEDWDFGLTTRERKPKSALGVVRKVFSEVPFPVDESWPRISVVVCSYNGSRTIGDTLDGLASLAYHNYEVILVNDGSTDDTTVIASKYDVKLINTENQGLSSARNTGWKEATGEIVAYIDDDAYPDPHWLHYLAWTFLHTDYVSVGGPNVAPPGDGAIADCIANAPGGPVHVLLSDTEAEHIPGCNIAIRRDALAAIGGFDVRFRVAGDDVDLCWRLKENAGKIGFHAAAINWHHQRNSVKTYWRQQLGYGKAEALLEEKWPEKYSTLGHFPWSGRLYGKGITEALKFTRSRIYGGPWGSALFQSIYQPATGVLTSLPLMPEWYLITACLGIFSVLGLAWEPLFWFTPFFVLGLSSSVSQAILSALKAEFPTPRTHLVQRMALHTLTALLHLIQPLARLLGRLRHGLTPWRQRIKVVIQWRLFFGSTIWSEKWRAPEDWLQSFVKQLLQKRVQVLTGGDFDEWDLELRGGLLGGARTLMALEEHGNGKQLLRFRVKPKFSLPGIILTAICIVLGITAILDGAWIVGLLLTLIGSMLLAYALRDYVLAASAFSESVREINLAQKEIS